MSYPGYRYERAARELPQLLERAAAGDAKARSAIVHAHDAATNYFGWPIQMRALALSLEPLEPIRAAVNAQSALRHWANLLDDLSEQPLVIGYPPKGGDA